MTSLTVHIRPTAHYVVPRSPALARKDNERTSEGCAVSWLSAAAAPLTALVAAGAVLLSIAGCKSPQATYLAQPEAISAQGPYVHPASGMTFPLAVDNFQRVSITRYDAEGLDVSAGYNLVTPGAGVAATVYVYPAPPLTSIGSPANVVASARVTLCTSEFERRKREIVAAHPGVRLIEERDAPSSNARLERPGRVAVFEYEDIFAGQRQPLHSELYVFCYIAGKWAIEYRFTSPKSFDSAAMITDFMARLPWPPLSAS